MDQAKAKQKIRAMKYLHDKVMYTLLFSSLVALLCTVLSSYSIGVSSLSVFINPKFSFIVLNVIVAFLVGESRLLGSRRPPLLYDLYSEYIEKTRSVRGQKGHSGGVVLEEAKEEENRKVINICEDKEIVLHEHEKEKLVEEKREEDDRDEFEDCSDESDELNQRVEDFIARIKKQRWAEARMLICGQAR